MIAALLRKAINHLHETAGGGEVKKINTICTALATLRPLIPVKVLASVSGVEPAAVWSFASDLGRPLLILEDAVQFRNEPVETWFRKHFRPSGEQLSEFITRLQPLARESAYVASTLPQLMLEAGHLSELIDLALSSSLLPSDPIEKRDVELNRLQFALKASLRAKRFADAAKLALKAGQETTGNTRLRVLLRDNTDLAAKLVEPGRVQEIVSRRMFDNRDGIDYWGTSEKAWTGSHHVYEASLLSYHPDFKGEARSRLRSAYDWLKSWSRLSEKERERERVTNRDIAEMALAHLNIHGPERCAAELAAWKPQTVSYRAGCTVAQRLIDQKRHDDLDQLALAATNDVYLLLAINLELRSVHRQAPEKSVEQALQLVSSKDVGTKESDLWDRENMLPPMTALVESAAVYQLKNNSELASALERHLPDSPPRGWDSPHSGQRSALLRAYALKAALKGEDLQPIDLAHQELREELAGMENPQDSPELKKLENRTEALLTLHKLWAADLLAIKRTRALAAAIAEVCREHSMFPGGDRSEIANEIAEILFDILTRRGVTDGIALEKFNAWIDGLRRPLYIPTWTRLARLAIHTPNCENLAYGFIQRAIILAKDARESADSIALMYVRLARSILAMDESEAREYFDKAIEVTSKIGDEIVDRWSAMLDLADRAAIPGQPCPKTAYRLARRAELAYQYVYRDKHFLWDHTVAAVAALCPSSCLAVLSRWRDRNFGMPERLIVYATDFLLRRRLIDPKTAAAFLGFRAHWDYGPYMRMILSACPTHSDREDALDFALRYMRLVDPSESTWKHLKQVAREHSLDISEFDPLIDLAKSREATTHNTTASDGDTGARKNGNDEINWDTVFLGLELHTANGLSRAHAQFKSNGPPFRHGEFFSELLKRIPAVKAVQAIRAFPNVAEFNGYDFRQFLEQLPKEWSQRQAVKSSIADTTRILCRRYCIKIVRDRFWQLAYWPVPIHLASKLSGVSEADLTLDVLAALGKRSETLEARRLFTLVGLLASHLSNAEALDALNFGLNLFDDALKENVGDGPWGAVLAPPADMNTAIAGYIWAALSAPQGDLRWEAAHVVRGICALNRKLVLERLLEFARNGKAGPFADSNFHFYHRHGRQWLMIALARAAVDNPTALTPHWDFFVHFALREEPHVVIRHFAAKAALTLVQSEKISLGGDQQIIAQLASVNDSKLPTVSSPRHRRTPTDSSKRSEARRFHFHSDMTWYWFDSVADNFAQSVPYIECEMEKTICDDWQYSQIGDWESDERNRRNIFQNRETWHSHGSYPKTDDLRFYLGYHAMMVVAGKLLATVPRHQDPNEPENEFSRWLGRHLLSREDGYWLADRRDPDPLEWPSWKDEKQDENWRSSVKRSDFDRVLGIDGHRWTVWGSWQAIFDEREESVYIASALVAPDRSFALLRALQTTTDPRNFRIPDAGDDMEIDNSGFRLKGWVENRDVEKGRDEVDPWAGNIWFPPLRPAGHVIDLFQLQPDTESRVWQIEVEDDRKEVFWSQIWGSGGDEESRYYVTEGENGKRLQASRTFIIELLGRVNMDLIVEVQIERRLLRHRGQRGGYESSGYLPPDHRIFLLRNDGRTYTL